MLGQGSTKGARGCLLLLLSGRERARRHKTANHQGMPTKATCVEASVNPQNDFQ